MVRPAERSSSYDDDFGDGFGAGYDPNSDDAPTDPHMRAVVPQDPPHDDGPALPPGFGAPIDNDGYRPHPVSNAALSTLTFRLRPEPWYRTNAAKIALLALVLAAGVAALVVLLWPTSTAPQDDSNTPAPAPTPSATVTPTTVATTPAQSRPPRPPGPPPPPPPPAATAEPRQSPQTRWYPRYDNPTPKRPPRINETRLPPSFSPDR